MIGPHEGKELELMLSGKKHLSAFGDIIPDDGEINEDIIPEKAFAPHVSNGTFKRFQACMPFRKDNNRTVQYVCFTTPGHEWRAHAYLWLREMGHRNQMPIDSAMEIMIGRLLSYCELDIQDYISKYGK